MAEGLATGLAIEAAKAATTLVAGRVLEGMTQAWGFKDQLKKLKTNITYIQAFLEDVAKAKNEEKRSKFVDLFLKDITDVVYSTEELMDDYEYELLRRKIELNKENNNHPSFKKMCNNFFRPATNPVVFRFRMSRRVQKIQSMLDELKTNARNNGIQLGQLARDAVATTSRGGYFAENEALHETRKHAMARDSSFVGRKDDKEMLLQNILNPIAGQADHLSIVSIVGIGGLGKTTIAQKLYEHDKVGGHFDKRIWICVSEDFRVDRLLNEMIESLTSTKSDLTNPDAITRKLQQHLDGKKFLLVLDDVWEDDQGVWDSFKNALLRIGGDVRGCVILITTRLNDVARKARALYQYKLPELSEDEGWNLLQQRVFTETLFPFNSCFEDVGRRIVKKCKGVPLAIKAIGGILQSKKHPYEWELVENSELWGIQQTGDVNNIMPWLLLSYNHLDDAYLKQCFAYCAIFPKDSKMEKHRLITLWLSQGYLQHESATSSSTSTLEIVGENYFDTLLNHSFLEKEFEFFGITLYKMHDLVHDLATYILKKDLLVWKVGMNLEDEFSHVRHLVFHLSNHEEPSEIFTRGLQVRKLRTIRFQADHDWINSPTLGSAQFIRTLIMANTGLKEVPSIIGQLVHLRYLDLSYNDEIDVLPESICKLYQLQTLRILFCNKLKKLPTELYKLQNLRHIVNDGYSMWASRRLGQLTNLQTLPSLELRDGEGWTIDELGPLHQLKGTVFIKGLEHVKDRAAARQANLGMKENVNLLQLEWDKDREAASVQVNNNDEDVFDSLEPHPNLQSLYVKGFMGVSFPRWMMGMVVKHGLDHPTPLTNLTEVDIIYCRRCRQLPTLGQLPFLQWLCLQGLDDLVCIGDEFYQRSSSSSYNNNSNNGSDLVRVTTAEEEEERVFFPSLRNLKILKCERLATWNPPSLKQAVAINLFPNLENLQIRDCPRLEEVPCLQLYSLQTLILDSIGGSQPLDIIKYSHALTSLGVTGMEKMMKLPEEVSNCTNLETLLIGKCVNMKSIPSGLISLKRLC